MAVTQNFTNPATGAVSPTAAQVQNQCEVICLITTDGVATTTTITHNLGVSAADLTLGYPDVILEPSSANAANGTLAAYISSKTANTVVLTFLAVVGILNVKITRPNTLVR